MPAWPMTVENTPRESEGRSRSGTAGESGILYCAMKTPFGPLRGRTMIARVVSGAVLLFAGAMQGAPFPNSARDITMPVFVSGEPKAAGVIRVQRVFPGLQRQGVFRIGFLPALVLDKVRIQVNQPEHAAAILRRVLDIGRQARRPEAIELRDVQILVAGETRPRLEAGTVLFDARCNWRLRDGVRLRLDGKEWRARSADLEADEAGKLALSVGSPDTHERITLFPKHLEASSKEAAQ